MAEHGLEWILALALAGALQAQVVVTPRRTALTPGQTCAFQAVLEGGEPSCRWSLADPDTGAIDERTGVYTAPEVAEAREVRVLASHPRRGCGEAVVTVLPRDPFALMGRVLSPDWLAPFSADLPFLDLASGRRFPGRVRKEHHGPRRRVLTGYGLRCSVAWSPQSGAQAALFSCLEGDEPVRRDVTGQSTLELAPRAPISLGWVESLRPVGGRTWDSHLEPLSIDVRGMFPFAGNAVAEAGHADGAGPGARFREAFDGVGAELENDWCLLVSDPQSHVLRRVSARGKVSTLCGEPGRPGHQDSPGLLRTMAGMFCRKKVPAPLFHRPTHLALARPSRGGPRDLLVADSGNHCIRRVNAQGQVDTVAGVPGMAGHRDSGDPRAALFNDPRGLAVGSRGAIYVADRGNRAIRRIALSGEVATLAGDPQAPAGSEDGQGTRARFSDLKGLAFVKRNGQPALLVLDGHAVRRISSPDLVVSTLAGQPGIPGFLDVPPGEGLVPDRMARQDALRGPCLNQPTGLHCRGGKVFIADRGNHAVRLLDLDQWMLTTVAGDPALAETRWGLLRDGAPGPLGAGYAALEAPSAITTVGVGAQALQFVTTGRCVARLRRGDFHRDRPVVDALDCPAPDPDGRATVFFRLLARDRRGNPMVRPFRYTVEFRGPDGGLDDRIEGEGTTPLPVTVQGRFSQPGRCTVLLRCVTDQGVSAGAERGVQLEPCVPARSG